MKLRMTSFALLFALLSAFVFAPAGSAFAKSDKKANPLKGVKAHAKIGDATLTVTQFSVNSSGKLVASGTVTTEKRGQVGTFSNAEVTVEPAQAGSCTILELNIQPIDINLLGLRVQTSEINLVISAEPGEGVLGDLLCTIANLLNGDQNAIANILNRVLAALGGGLPTGTVLTGLLPINITGFTTVETANGPQLTATFFVRTLSGTVVGPFTAPVTLQQNDADCTILDLSLGPIDLNILGLRVELFGETRDDPVTITITGETGPGKLLGNLLCGIAGLLDGNPNLTQLQRLNFIAQILNRILAL